MLLMRGFDSPGLLLLIGAELWGFFLLYTFFFLLLHLFFFFLNSKVSGVHLTRRNASRPQMISPPSRGLSIISAPLLWDILPTVLSVLAGALFFLLSSPPALPLALVHAPANFMEGQSLENPQGRRKQSGDSYLFPK